MKHGHILSFIYSNKKGWLARRVNFEITNKRKNSKFLKIYRTHISRKIQICSPVDPHFHFYNLLPVISFEITFSLPILFHTFFHIVSIFFETLECHISRNSHRDVKMCKFIASSMAKKKVLLF